jgi:hypothetical protein
MTRTEYSFRDTFREWCGADSLRLDVDVHDLEQGELVFISHSHSLTRPLSKRSERSPSVFFSPLLCFPICCCKGAPLKKRKKESVVSDKEQGAL